VGSRPSILGKFCGFYRQSVDKRVSRLEEEEGGPKLPSSAAQDDHMPPILAILMGKLDLVYFFNFCTHSLFLF